MTVITCSTCGYNNMSPDHYMTTSVPSAYTKDNKGVCWNCSTVLFEKTEIWKSKL